MKKTLLSILLLAGMSAAFAQTQKFTLQPGAAGIDANIFSRSDAVNSNKGNDPELFAEDWTWDGESGTMRSLIKFDLSTVPANIQVDSVKLFLFVDNNVAFTSGIDAGHSSLSRSNAATLKRVTGPWDESTVTWNTQPTTGKDSILLAQSTSASQNYVIKVTSMVKDMMQNPKANFGFLLKILDENEYNGLVFGSSDHATAALHPALTFYYNTTTGVNDLATAKTAINAYPNPNNGSFKIDADNLVSVVVSDINGNTESFDSANITTSLKGILTAKIITADTIEVVKLFVK